jgi:hypothetical protein
LIFKNEVTIFTLFTLQYPNSKPVALAPLARALAVRMVLLDVRNVPRVRFQRTVQRLAQIMALVNTLLPMSRLVLIATTANTQQLAVPLSALIVLQVNLLFIPSVVPVLPM